jgi:hypothetical protein
MSVLPKKQVAYLRLELGDGLIEREEDGLTLARLCLENAVNRILLPAECLSHDCLRLSTRIAGAVLQKLTNYNI